MLPFAARRTLIQLKRRLGGPQVLQELEWMLDAKVSNSTMAGWLKRRVNGEPLQYILGTQPFGKLDLVVSPPTLIPRSETEEWSFWLSEELKSCINLGALNMRLTGLDLCTGTGCIPLLLSSELPQGRFRALGVDVSFLATSLATQNAEKFTSTSQNSVEIQQWDVFSDDFLPFLQGHPLYPFNVLTSNPPYIPFSDWLNLPHSVKAYEDPIALIGEVPGGALIRRASTSGLAFYHRIAELLVQDPFLVQSGGRIVLEVGRGQSRSVLEILAKALGARSSRVHLRKDWNGIERIVCVELGAGEYPA